MTVYGIWDLDDDRWATDEHGRQFQTDDINVALDCLEFTPNEFNGEVRETPPDEVESFHVAESIGGEKGIVWEE